MAQIDVSDAFDEMFLTSVGLKRPKLKLNDEGEWGVIGFSFMQIKAVIIPGTASVTHNSENNFRTEQITVYTRDVLDLQTDDTAPDYILYNNKEYRVDSVQDFMAYGGGYCVAECSLNSPEES